MKVILEVGQDSPVGVQEAWELSPRIAADLAAGLANILSDRGSYKAKNFGVSEENPLVRVICKGFFVSIRWIV